MKGIFEFELEGNKKVGFKYGTYGISISCEKEGCAVDELFRRCGMPYLTKGADGKPEVRADQPKLQSLLHLVYGAAVHYAEDNNIPVDFKVSTVSNWLDEIGEEKLKPMMVDSLTQYIPKNLKSLAETGEKATA